MKLCKGKTGTPTGGNAGSAGILVDPNILLRAIQNESPLCALSRTALKSLHRQNCRLCITPQNIREFWNVCTRPTDRNGLGMSAPGTELHIRFLEKYFTILPDSIFTYRAWRQLVTTYDVRGVKVHDAWLVAAMKAHGVNRILSFNVADFARYTGIECIDPRTL